MKGSASTRLSRKLDRLRCRVRELGRAAIAFSGGIDSAFLAAVAAGELGDQVLAVTAYTPLHPRREQREAARLARRLGLRHARVELDPLALPGMARNPPDRCYRCKQALFRRLRALARREAIPWLLDGTQADDRREVRPGRRAARECGVLSPLLEAGLTKAEIRRAARRMGLTSADQPALACLATRFPEGARLTRRGLEAVDRLEEGLRGLGFVQVRARVHGSAVRLELAPRQIRRAARPDTARAIARLAHRAGFNSAAVDLEGYRCGSMNGRNA